MEHIELLDSRVKASKSQCMAHSCRKRSSLQRERNKCVSLQSQGNKLASCWLKWVHISISVADDYFKCPSEF